MGTDDAPESVPPGTRPIPKPGETIDGKYALISVLGKGGMGIVYEAEHLRLKQRCAIKMLSPAMLSEKEIVHRFEREARASAQLKGPHVTRVTDVATTSDGLPYIVMELLAGRDLDAEIEERHSIPYKEAVDYVLQACAAVAEAHAAGIIHRDLKPGNLFLAREETGVVVKVLDFGISKMTEEATKLTTANTTMGTALYMSPEQLRSAATVDARSDIWSLGVILYELVAGEPPFVGTAPQVAVAIVSEDAPDITRRAPIPTELGAVINRMMERDPADRFPSVADLAATLAPFAEPESLGASVASQIARRNSSRSLPVEADRSSSRRLVLSADSDVQTVARDVSTGVSHEVNTAAGRHESPPRKLLWVALVVVGLAAAIVSVAVFMRGSTPAQTSPVAASPVSAPSVGPDLPVVPPVVSAEVSEPPASAVPPPASAAATTKATAKPGTAAAPPARPTRPPTSAAPPAHPPAKPAGGQSPTQPTFL